MVFDSSTEKLTIKRKLNPKIPYNLYKTGPYTYNNLPLDFIKAINTSSKHLLADFYYYNDNECRDLIRDNFESKVLKAYDMLIPTAYKADLWRYCILYLYGGIYSDVGHTVLKYFQINRKNTDMILTKDRYITSPLINGIDQESHIDNSIQISFMATIPKNNFFMFVINNVAKDILKKRYNRNEFDITGPTAFGRLFAEFFNYKKNINNDFANIKKLKGLDGKIYKILIPLYEGNNHTLLNWKKLEEGIILTKTPNYHSNMYRTQKPRIHYSLLWNNKNVYHQGNDIL